jgi:hypothetical protein
MSDLEGPAEAGDGPAPEVAPAEGITAPRLPRRFSLTRLKAGFSYPLRAARLRRGLLLPAALVLLSLVWGQVDHFLYYNALPQTQRDALLEYQKRPSVTDALPRLLSPRMLLWAAYRGLAHAPSAALTFLVARARGGGGPQPSLLVQWGRSTALALPSLALASFLMALLIVLLLRVVRKTQVPTTRLLVTRALLLMAVWFCLYAAYSPVYYVPWAIHNVWAYWFPWLFVCVLFVPLLLVPYTIVGAGLGVERGVLASVRLLWRHPLEVVVIVLTCGLVRDAARVFESRNTFTLWLRADSGLTRHVVLGTLGDVSLLIIPALITAWTMAAFLLFVLDNAREAGQPTSA